MRRRLALILFVSVALTSALSIAMLARVRPVDIDWPDYAAFLQGVAAHTSRGDSIALLVPARRDTTDYDYAYFRASYMLPGRVVVPVIENDRAVPENLQRAKYVAMWRGHLALRRAVVWSGHHGELLGPGSIQH